MSPYDSELVAEIRVDRVDYELGQINREEAVRRLRKLAGGYGSRS